MFWKVVAFCLKSSEAEPLNFIHMTSAYELNQIFFDK